MQNAKNSQKYKIYAIFLLISCILAIFIIKRFSIDSNIYSLLNLSNEEAIITQNMRESLSNEIIFLSDNIEIFQYLQKQNNGIFKDIITSLETSTSLESNKSLESPQHSYNNMLDLLDSYKLATLDFSVYSEIINNDNFIKTASEGIFHSFIPRILPLKSDFLNLTSHSSLLKNTKIDFSNASPFVMSDNVKYYIARGILSDNVKSHALLKLIRDFRDFASNTNASLLISGGAIFAAVGEERGNIESFYMSIISLIFIAILLYNATSNVHIFKLIFIIAFGFLCGMAGGFAIFGKIHLLSIVISTSLIGLILDFSMHFLSLNYKRHTPISRIKKVLIVGLLVSCSGYGVFLLSQMQLLIQIAIMAIFTLFGAFIATYFLLPQMIASSPKPSKIFRFCFLNYILFFKKSTKKWLFMPILLAIISIPFFIKSDFSDNINDYYAPPKSLIDEAISINKILQNTSAVQFIVIESVNSNDLIQKERSLGDVLMQNGTIDAYSGISNIFLSPKEQNLAKEKLLDSLAKNTSFLQELGFSKNDIFSFKKQLESIKIIDFRDNLHNIFEVFKINRFIVQDSSNSQNSKNSRDSAKIKDSKNSHDSSDSSDSKNSHDSTKTQDSSDFQVSTLKTIMFLKNPKITANSDFNAILNAHNATFIDFNTSMNSGFEAIKINAIALKIAAFACAFVILGVFFGIKLGAFMTLMVVSATILSLCVMVICGVKINIFSIFGLILASVVGIDYMIFALHKRKIPAILGIILASLTSIISFGIIATSHFGALSAFGFASALGMLFCAIFASIFALKKF